MCCFPACELVNLIREMENKKETSLVLKSIIDRLVKYQDKPILSNYYSFD